MRADLTQRLTKAVARITEQGVLPSDISAHPELMEPKSKDHGDFATNFALVSAKAAKTKPLRVAQALAEELAADEAFESAEIAGPGFVNLTLRSSYLAERAKLAFDADTLGCVDSGQGKRILVEFVSVNPNGPIHIGHGRGAAYGDSLSRVLRAAGNEVSKEYYVNDGVNSLQMKLFSLSVRAYYRRLVGESFDFPEDGYKGEHLEAIAQRILEEHGPNHANDGPEFFQPISQAMMLEQQKLDLERFGVAFDNWFSEQSMHEKGEVAEAIDWLRAKNEIYEQDEALFLKTTEFGDDKDRCVVRSSGEPTYIASDIAYHKDKFDRGFDHLIDIWGPDHHGYVARTKAAVSALGYPSENLELIITQIVRFVENGQPKPMRKRNGDFYRLSDLIDEIGADVCRFFYLMRSTDTHMDFDLGLAKEHSDKNPVYYVQYAHARISSLLSKANDEGLQAGSSHVHLLSAQPERDLIKKIWDLPHEVGRAAEDRGVHRLTTYAVELAREYHNFYDKCPVIRAETRELATARLMLCEATRKALRETFDLLGISAPTSM
jgi:arginyl-tRNA synthetase